MSIFRFSRFAAMFSLLALVFVSLAGLVDRASAALDFNTAPLEQIESSAALDAYKIQGVTIEQSYRAFRAWDQTAAAK